VKIGRVGFLGVDETVETVETDEVATRRAARERQLRTDAARRNPTWTEIPAERLVGRGWRDSTLVDAATDRCYLERRGSTFVGTAIMFDQDVRLHFYVDERIGPVVLEEQPGTWSERVERQARADARKATAPGAA